MNYIARNAARLVKIGAIGPELANLYRCLKEFKNVPNAEKYRENIRKTYKTADFEICEQFITIEEIEKNA